ncbi:hypothetical protein FHW75_003969 [Pseudomonas sp. OG7]|uniref:DUF6957 family protein n=1 Tax=Pseudomonas sp. OG7 TaxID=2587037 RepID=UPI00160F0970|nr:hypothetical protein [Pseudomonas sp. OG7]MBB3272773.1 hypothetical protein [Pseudomonas sp. OG7]
MNELLEDVFYGAARMLMGSGLADEPLLAAAREEFAGQQYCVVREWLILDVMASEGDQKLISARDLQPVLLYAQRVMFDTRGVRQGGVLLTGFLRQYEDCFFEAEEMVYVLGGRGARKHISMPALRELSKMCGVIRMNPSQRGCWPTLEACAAGDREGLPRAQR